MKKNAISWIIRIVLIVTVYVVFWDRPFIQESLYFVVPLVTLSFAVAFLLPRYRKKNDKKK